VAKHIGRQQSTEIGGAGKINHGYL
jgi:hypothetical protein